MQTIYTFYFEGDYTVSVTVTEDRQGDGMASALANARAMLANRPDAPANAALWQVMETEAEPAD